MKHTPPAARTPDALLRRMQSLADESRLRLLHLLERHELGVADLVDVLQLPQSTVSRHLKVLSDEGWTRSRRQGTHHLYRLIESELDPAARKLWLLSRDQTHDWPAIRQDELRLARILRQRETESQNFFAGAAAEWDKLRSEMYGTTFSHSALLALIPRDYIIADLGCGTGQLSEQLSPHVQKIIAVDNSPAMLKAARKRFGHRADREQQTDRADSANAARANADRTGASANVDLRRGDLTAIPIDSASVDAALLVLVLAYVDDPPAVLAEMSRITKPGGRAILIDLLPHTRDDFRRHLGQLHLGFSPDSLRSTLSTCGFADTTIQIHPLIPDPGAKGPALFLASAKRSAS